jgi:hypothetical protein
MARVTVVKSARQRYATVQTGDTTPVMSRSGAQKVTKRGTPVVRRTVEYDYTKPLPNHTCENCHTEITVGSPYKWVAPKSGPYGGRKRYRCATCPSWQPWELSNALWARIAQIVAEAQGVSTTDADDVRSALETAAEAIRDLASEKEEGAQNMEDGFGHETEQSSQLRETADSLNSWADEIDAKAGEIEDGPEEPDEDASEQTREEYEDALSELETTLEDAMSILDESPV